VFCPRLHTEVQVSVTNDKKPLKGIQNENLEQALGSLVFPHTMHPTGNLNSALQQ
jgi:hypothetical protein